MKIALNWIARYLDSVPPAAAVQEALINAGLVVENVQQSHGTQVLDVEVTSNRTDCFSHIGLARELAALFKLKFTIPEVKLVESGEPAAQHLAVEILTPELCSYYSARIIHNVQVGPSPQWLRAALESVGMRSVNNVVDVTNFVLMETGQPLHAFDAAKIHEQRIIVDTAADGQTLTALDGRSYTLNASMMVIGDVIGPLAIAGVMGGQASSVTDSTQTVVLESARFNPLSIRATARALTLFSDSSFRFERGIDPAMAEYASRRAAALIVEVAGGTLAPGCAGAGSVHTNPVTVTLRPQRSVEILGVRIPLEEALDILRRLELAAELKADRIVCSVPSFRSDITREIDLIEELVRLWGYGQVPVHSVVTHQVPPADDRAQALRTICHTLSACGFCEAITHSFVEQAEARQFLPAGAAPLQVSELVRKAENTLRPSIWAGLLRARALNQNNGGAEVRLFEYCSVFWQELSAGDRPMEQRHIALIADAIDHVLAAVQELLKRLNPAARLIVQPQDGPGLARNVGGRCLISLNQTQFDIGAVGLISPEVLKFYDLRRPAAVAELELEKLINVFNPVRLAQPLPRFPAVQRDVSIVVTNAVRWADISTSIHAGNLQFLESVEFVGTFRNAQIGAGKKSLTFTLVFRDPRSTLRSEQVDQQVNSALAILAARFNATLRA
ncbi:MAG: phenylalanine--tRNA ligase subunit beta [Phycisphaerae bacterium]